jgi:hypothetical protein
MTHWWNALSPQHAGPQSIVMAKPDWGDVPTWLAFIAAVAAGIAAVFLYKTELERDRIAAADRRAQAEEARRSQANKVAAWYVARTATYGDNVRLPGFMLFGAMIRNASDLPIYDVYVTFYQVTHSSVAGKWGVIEVAPAKLALRVVPPGETELVNAPETMGAGDQQRFVVGIEFRDAAGGRWERDAMGQLRPNDKLRAWGSVRITVDSEETSPKEQ